MEPQSGCYTTFGNATYKLPEPTKNSMFTIDFAKARRVTVQLSNTALIGIFARKESTLTLRYESSKSAGCEFSSAVRKRN